ncbi:MAG: sensory protein TspO [Candidatus Xenobia bacterium]
MAAVVLTAVLGALATNPQSAWYLELVKPSWQPPGWLFGPVWTLLYALIATSAVIVWHATEGNARRELMLLFAVNLMLNLAWSALFFRAQSPLGGGVEIILLLGSIAHLGWRCSSLSPVAAWLLAPYFAWVAFATILNWTIAILNWEK